MVRKGELPCLLYGGDERLDARNLSRLFFRCIRSRMIAAPDFSPLDAGETIFEDCKLLSLVVRQINHEIFPRSAARAG
jgi:hypothetical protein